MTNRTAFRWWVLTLVFFVVAALVSIAYVDRAAAEFFEAHLRHTALWVWLDHALRPLDLAVVLALSLLFGCGIWVLSGRQLHRRTETPLLCSWAMVWAVAATIVCKHIFGRGWPDPTYLHDHLYGFRLLHGAPHWDSFPSGTATISSAIASVLWIVHPRWRALTLLAVVLLSVAVVITNYHWVSDVIAGVFLGATIGWSTIRLCKSRNSFNA
jgi:membrane-associated phospholipid phosphatase